MPQIAPRPPQTDSSRLRRAMGLVAQGRVSQSRREPTTYHISALDNRHAYTVQLEGPALCTCPDHAYRRVHCKHWLAATLVHLARRRCTDCGRSDCRGSYKPDGNHGLAF